MSFASDVKAELTLFNPTDKCCLHAELDAMLKIGGTATDNRLELIVNSAGIARRALSIIRKIYPDARTEIIVVRIKKRKKFNRYAVRIFLSPSTRELFDHFFGNEFPKNDCCYAAYLRGAFLARGTVNRPESQYHWEITAPDEPTALFLLRLMNSIDFPVKLFVRLDKFVVYMKEFDMIVDFLSFVGAPEAVERCEIARNRKGVRALANRLVNCETYNVQAAVEAAQRQIADILLIRKKRVKLPPELSKTARARIKYPYAPLSELASLMKVSKSTIKDRMRRLRAIAAELR